MSSGPGAPAAATGRPGDMLLILRWEAADASGQRFPVLDADITVVPDGEHAALVELVGVYRPPPWAGPCPVIAYLVTAATTHSLLGRIAAAISDPPRRAARASRPRRRQARHAGCRLADDRTTREGGEPGGTDRPIAQSAALTWSAAAGRRLAACR